MGTPGRQLKGARRYIRYVITSIEGNDDFSILSFRRILYFVPGGSACVAKFVKRTLFFFIQFSFNFFSPKFLFEVHGKRERRKIDKPWH